MDETVLIIGGGLGGLFTGALLARNGCRVTVLEKNATPGGGLQTFVRGGERFETGMHMLGGFRPGGSIARICHYLGVLDRLKLRPTDPRLHGLAALPRGGRTLCHSRRKRALYGVFCRSVPSRSRGNPPLCRYALPPFGGGRDVLPARGFRVDLLPLGGISLPGRRADCPLRRRSAAARRAGLHEPHVRRRRPPYAGLYPCVGQRAVHQRRGSFRGWQFAAGRGAGRRHPRGRRTGRNPCRGGADRL